MTPEQWHAMIAVEGPLLYHTPPEYRGQIVTRSYAQHGDCVWEMIVDASGGSRVVNAYTPAPGCAIFEPWNCTPALGELLWTETEFKS